ncbi:MAG: DNA mismatch repair protein MutS, partial [Deltaproteobacteria bacterium]|nr:DNA mismatch repair protein MutS [Deltaproteobacteria bacterium]
YEAALARLEDRWRGQGQGGEGLVDGEHPFATDLDLMGEGSLFELLCQARSRAGERTLARWLLSPHQRADGEEDDFLSRLGARTAAVAALRDAVDVREHLALVARGVRAEVEPDRLQTWGEAPRALPQSLALWIALWIPALATPTALALALAGTLPWTPFLILLAVEGAIYRIFGARVERVVSEVDTSGRQLKVVASVLSLLEAQRFSAPRLRTLQDRLQAEGVRASESVAALDRRLVWLEAMKNPMVAPLGFLLLWPLHMGAAVERWRLRYGGQIRVWFQTLGELEAIYSLAGYAYDHPEDPFAELVALDRAEGDVSGAGARLEGEALRHPLMAKGRCVANDIVLVGLSAASTASAPLTDGDSDAAVWMVSGSNMSGKSTYLRTVGSNVALALLGAPVAARRLRLTPLALGATLRIQDSLHDGRSRFFAEVRRLKLLMDSARDPTSPPLLFLLDELLHGTNSQDRQTGAFAILSRYVAEGGIGLVTTHDLALGAQEAKLPWLANRHFTDAVAEGKMDGETVREEDALSFDYRLRDGRLEGSNALALMRAVGLDV